MSDFVGGVELRDPPNTLGDALNTPHLPKPGRLDARPFLERVWSGCQKHGITLAWNHVAGGPGTVRLVASRPYGPARELWLHDVQEGSARTVTRSPVRASDVVHAVRRLLAQRPAVEDAPNAQGTSYEVRGIK